MNSSEDKAENKQKRDEAGTKLTEIEEADGDRWEGLKDGLENIWTNINPELCGNRRDFLVLSLLNQFFSRRTGLDPGWIELFTNLRAYPPIYLGSSQYYPVNHAPVPLGNGGGV